MTDHIQLARRGFLQATGAGLAGLAAGCGGGPQRPNIVYVFSDQQHWEAAGYRNAFYDTPAQDELAKESFVFENFFCSTPQCSPSRSSMFTGLYPSATGVMGNIGAAGGDDLAMETFGPALQRAGYRTGYFGKWHLGDNPTAHAGWHEEFKEQQDLEATNRAVEFIGGSAAGDQPFAAVVSYLDPHDIYYFKRDMGDLAGVSAKLPESWAREDFDGKPPVQKQFMTDDQGTAIWGSEQKVWEWYREHYRSKVRLYDDYLGRVVQALKDSGAWENTILVVSSDHGDMDTHHRLIFKGPFLYEHMVRIPLLIRFPAGLGGAPPRQVLDYQGVNTDIAPTILDFAGLDPETRHGQSLKPLLTGGAAPRREFVIGEYYSKQKWVNPIRMIRTPEFKYNRYLPAAEELYDLKNDPHELVNLAGDEGYATRKRELAAELDRWIKEQGDPFYSLQATDREGNVLSG